MKEDESRSYLLVTGATGFIGRALCIELQALGYRLVVLTRNPAKAEMLLGADVCCVSSSDSLPKVPFSALINLAGEPLAARRWNSVRKLAFRESRIGLTENLLNHFQQQGTVPDVVISGSAIGFYGDCGDEMLTEDSPAGTGFAAELCRDCELIAEGFATAGSRVCQLRTGIVLDAGGGALSAMLPAFRLGLGGPMGGGRQWMSWIHRGDLVAMILYCLHNPLVSGPVNGVAPEPVTNREFALALGRALHRPACLPMPAPVLCLLMGELADQLLLASQRVIPDVALKSGFEFRYPQLDKALSTIFPTLVLLDQ